MIEGLRFDQSMTRSKLCDWGSNQDDFQERKMNYLTETDVSCATCYDAEVASTEELFAFG